MRKVHFTYWLTLFSLYFLILRLISFLAFFYLRLPSFANLNYWILMGIRRNINGKLFDFEYHIGIWFKYDQFGFNLSRPSFGSPLMVWCTEINSSDTFWSFPNCPKMTNFPKSDHFQAFRKWPNGHWSWFQCTKPSRVTPMVVKMSENQIDHI